MFKQKANQAYYKLHLSEIDDDSINVLYFEGEEKISGLFEYRIEIISKDMNLDSSKILNKPATFTFVRGDDTSENINGIISNFEYFGRTSDYAHYIFKLVPRLWRLNLVYQNEVYQKIKIDKLIEEVLSDAGLTGSAFKIDLKSSYAEMEYIVQYRESNFNFLNRRLEHFGIFYYFDHSNGSDTVVFTDANSKLPLIHNSETIEFNENRAFFGDTETIIDFKCSEKVVTGKVKLKDYNYMFPEKQLMAESQINSQMPGLFYDFGDNFENEKDAEFLAKIRDQEFLCQSKIFSGISDSRLFRAGYRFKLKSFFRDDWNSEYILRQVSLKGSQPGLAGYMPREEVANNFECRFSAIPFDVDFRPPRITPVPKINGIMSAKIESGSSDDYAFVDDSGRYKAKMLFDISDKTNGEATMPIRLAQNYTGPGYGTHFPNHKGAELLWACVDGNVDRPVGLATVPNPSQASPVVSKNKSQSVIRTAANNEIVIEDKGGSEQIHINQACGNEIIMKAEGPDIEIKQKCGNQIVMKEAEGIDIKDKYGNEIKLDSSAGTLTLKSPTHNSSIVLGMSEKTHTDSNKEESILGDVKCKWVGTSNEIKIGDNAEYFGGIKRDHIIGAEISAGMSKKIEKNLSERIFKSHKHFAEIISSHKEEVGDYELNATTSIRLKGGTAVVLSYSKSNKINISKEGITIEAKNIKLDGNVEITGELSGKKLMKNGSIEANP